MSALNKYAQLDATVRSTGRPSPNNAKEQA